MLRGCGGRSSRFHFDVEEGVRAGSCYRFVGAKTADIELELLWQAQKRIAAEIHSSHYTYHMYRMLEGNPASLCSTKVR